MLAAGDAFQRDSADHGDGGFVRRRDGHGTGRLRNGQWLQRDGQLHEHRSGGELPGPATLTSARGNFNVTLKTAGPRRVTATDSASSAINGTSSTITVSAGAAANFLVTASRGA